MKIVGLNIDKVCMVLGFSLSFLFFSMNQVEAEVNQKAKVRIRMGYLKSGPEDRFLMVNVITKIEKVYVPVPGVTIKLYLTEPTESGLLGDITMDGEGKGKFALPDRFYEALDTLDEFYFIASLTDNPDYKDKETDLTIGEVELKVDFIDQDSLKLIEATVVTQDSGSVGIPQEDVEIKFLTERLFSYLPIGEEVNSTDENGKISISFPLDLPGGPEGQVNMIVRIDDHDEFGTVEFSKTIKWGVPVHVDPSKLPRALWSPKPPIWMVITFIILMSGVYFHFGWVLINLYKIANDKSENELRHII